MKNLTFQTIFSFRNEKGLKFLDQPFRSQSWGVIRAGSRTVPAEQKRPAKLAPDVPINWFIMTSILVGRHNFVRESSEGEGRSNVIDANDAVTYISISMVYILYKRENN